MELRDAFDAPKLHQKSSAAEPHVMDSNDLLRTKRYLLIEFPSFFFVLSSYFLTNGSSPNNQALLNMSSKPAKLSSGPQLCCPVSWSSDVRSV